MTTRKKNEFSTASTVEDKINFDLLNSQTQFLVGDIDGDSVTHIIKWITTENFDPKPDKILTLYINSDGGSLTDAFALVDIMRSSKCKIRTIGIGSIISAGFLIFAAGTKDERYISKNTTIMCHQYSDEFTGKYHDILSYMKESEMTHAKIIKFFHEVTGLDNKTIKSKLLPPTDVWLSVEEMIDLRIADHILN